MDAKERFLRYVTYYTTSDDSTGTSPSTERQKDLGRLLMKELDELGLVNIRMDAAGNVLATLPAKDAANAPVLALIAHMDTAPDAPGEHVKPRIVRYEGGELKLNDTVSLTEALCPGISQFIGKELIVTDGTTLLGADDKAGVAEIMAAVEQLIASGAAHGELRIIFTTDEEIGNGVDGLDVESLGCDLGYTVDGGAIDEFEYENFNAAAAQVKVRGVNIHPGSAKNQMKNALLIGMEFNGMLPAWETPAHTEGYEGFYHLCEMQGDEELTTLSYILRDHDADKLEQKKETMCCIAAYLNQKWGEGTVEVTIKDSYRNMREMLEPHMEIVDKAKDAFEACGVTPIVQPIRGGTDGARLSYMGLLCPNLSTGGYNFHGRKELISVQAMEKMVDVLMEIAKNA